jgi:transposase
MYLRHSTKQVNGKPYTYWRLVRAVRRNGKVAQETVAQLGELDAQGRIDAKDLCARMCGQVGQLELWEDNPVAETIQVRVDRIRVERSRDFGDVWLGWTLWRALQLDTLCASLMPEGNESVAWSTMAAVLVIARLCEPSSELHIAEDWYRKTALDDILDLPVARVNDDRLYRAHDHLLPHKEAIEQHLRKRMGELFSIDYDLLLYDVTSTYFEGLAEKNDLARRGHSRDHRSDCKQVCIALVVTREGIPLGYEVFPGNKSDMATVEHIVEGMEKRFGIAKRVWVMDRGMGSDANVKWLKETGRRYLIGTPKAAMKSWRQAILNPNGWTTIRDGLQVKLCSQESETFVICRSADRAQKESAMHDRFAKKIEESLERIERRLARAKKPVDRGALERQIGRLLGSNERAAGRYRIQLVDDASRPGGLRLVWSVQFDWNEWARESEGCYVLRTNVTDWSGDELWRTYIQLTQAEAAFRIHKSDLSIRPIWHQKAERVQAHILVCFLAYALWKTLEQWQIRADLGNSPRTILEELHRIQSTDVVLPIAGDGARELRIRCVVRPDPDQAALLDRLGLRLPERLRIPTHRVGV